MSSGDLTTTPVIPYRQKTSDETQRYAENVLCYPINLRTINTAPSISSWLAIPRCFGLGRCYITEEDTRNQGGRDISQGSKPVEPKAYPERRTLI